MNASENLVLMIGSTSDIGRAITKSFASRGHPMVLAARDLKEAERDASDIRIRFGVPVWAYKLDVLEPQIAERTLSSLPRLPDLAICVVGAMVNQEECERSFEKAVGVIRTNFEGPACILGMIANLFENRGSGTIIGIGSVAGDRGRASNYVYGSAKAGFEAFLSGLRNRLSKAGVRVVTVKPGFVNTRMLEGIKTPRLLTAEPEEVGEAVYRAWSVGRDVIYVRPIWRLLMFVIRGIPELFFKRMEI